MKTTTKKSKALTVEPDQPVVFLASDLHIGQGQQHDSDILRGFDLIEKHISQFKGVDITVILPGDVYDKPRPTPQHEKIFADCLFRLHNAHSVLVIDGNHDKTGSNASTLDLFQSQFYEEIDYKFMVQSTIVSTENNRFYFEPFQHGRDLKEIGNNIQINPNVKHILVTHADVPGAVSGAEREIQLGHVGTLPVLSDIFDFIISGHIHKHQFFKYGGVPVLYPGALARVSHSEADEEKGFVIMNAQTLDFDFIVHGESRKFVTIEYDWKAGAVKLPKMDNAENTALRLRINAKREQYGLIDTREIQRKLSPQYSEVKVEIKYDKKADSVVSDAQKAAKGISFLQQENRWVKENVDKKLQADVLKQLRAILANVTVDKHKREYTNLTLKSIQIEDYQAIAKADKKFEPNDCVGILAEIDGEQSQSNGAGKSSFLEDIRWVLYGKTRFSKSESAIRDGQERASSQLVFSSSRGDLTISRAIGSANSASVHDKSGKLLAKGKEVAAWVETNLGLSLKAFDAIIYYGSDRHNIIGSSPTERLKALQEPLPLDQYEKAVAVVAKKKRDVAVDLSKKEGVYEDCKSSVISDEDIDTIKDELKEAEKGHKEQQHAIKQLESQLEAVRQAAEEAEEREELEASRADLTAKIKKSGTDLTALEKQKAALEAKVVQKFSQKEYDSLSGQMTVTVKALASAEANLGHVSKRIDLVKKGKCPECGSSLEKDEHYAAEVEKYNELIESITKGDKFLSQTKKRIQELDKVKEAETAHKKSQTDLNHRLTVLQTELKSMQTELKSVETRLGKLKPVTGKQMSEAAINYELKTARSTLEEFESTVSEHKQTLANHQANKAKLVKVEAELELLQNEVQVLNILTEALGPRGISQTILMAIIEETNQQLPVVVDEYGFWQELKVWAEPDDGKKIGGIAIYAKINGKQTREYEGLSQGEKEITNFVFRTAYSRVLEELIDISYSFRLIDEALDTLDEANLQAAIRFFKGAKWQTFCISHSNLKDSFTRTAIVVNKDGASHVV